MVSPQIPPASSGAKVNNDPGLPGSQVESHFLKKKFLFPFYFFSKIRSYLQPKLALNLRSSCLNLHSVVITDVHYYIWLDIFYILTPEMN